MPYTPKKNDKVTIVNSNEFYNGRTGKVDEVTSSTRAIVSLVIMGQRAYVSFAWSQLKK